MRKITLLAGVLLAFCAGNLHAQTEVLGKNEYGRIFDLTYSLKEQNTLYALTMSSHVVVSHDNGATWDVFYALPSVGSGASISQLNLSEDGTFLSFISSENSVGVLYILDIATQEITKTYHLPNASESPFISAYNFYGSDRNTLIVSSQFAFGFGAANRVYVTQDGGSTWKEIYFSADSKSVITSDVAFSPADHNTVYIANENGSEDVYGGLLISTDGGDTFTEKLSGIVLSKIEFNPSNANEIYVGTGIAFGVSPENLHHSTDGGITWEEKNITFGTNGILNDIVAIQFNPNDNNHIMVLEEDEIISSKDGGTTWQSVEYPYDNLDSYYYGSKASFNPFKAGEVMITSNYKPLFSADHAETLTQLQTPFFSSAGGISLFENTASKHLFYGVQGGFVHRNLMDNTDIAHHIKPLNAVSNTNGTRYIADAKQEGRIYSFVASFMGSKLSVSDDFGATFSPIYTTYSNGLMGVIADPQISNQVWATFSNSDQGELSRINFNDPDNTVVTNLTLPAANAVYKIVHLNNTSSEFLILIGSEVYQTSDSGENWTKINIASELTEETAVFDLVQNPKNADHLALGTSVGVFTSVDKGLTWNRVSGFVTNKLAYSDANSGVLVATTYTGEFEIFDIHYSVDNGATWKTVKRADLLETESTSVAIDFSDKKAYLYIASFDLGLLGYNLNLDVLASSDVPTKKADILVYPNPAADVVHFDTKNLKSAALFNMEGRQLMETKDTKVNVSGLPKGVYILKIITADNTIISKKIIKK